MPLQLYKIASNELSTAASTVTFDNIPQGYTDLKIVGSIRNSAADTNTDTKVNFNSNTSGYSAKRLFGNGSSAGSDTQSPTNGFYFVLTGEGTNWTANTFSNGEIYIPNYAGATNKSYSGDAVAENNATAASAQLTAGLWSNTAAITSITLTSGNGNFVQYTTFTLYGIL
jgi:hypothetical protein